MSDAQKEMKPVIGYDASGQTVIWPNSKKVFINQVRSRKSLKLTTNHSKGIEEGQVVRGRFCA